jgi:hypothetical protein
VPLLFVHVRCKKHRGGKWVGWDREIIILAGESGVIIAIVLPPRSAAAAVVVVAI